MPRPNVYRLAHCATARPYGVLLALCVGSAVSLGAQARPGYRDTERLISRGGADTVQEPVVVISMSGGISLGSYQAGVNWGLLEVYRAARHHPSFATAFGIPRIKLGSMAGASAGNINTLLWAIEGCTRGAALLPPETSLFWQIWTRIGLPELLPRGLKAASSDRALFHRGFFRTQLLDVVKQRLDTSNFERPCHVRIGITLTRLMPDTVDLDALKIPTQRFVTAFNARVDSHPANVLKTPMHFVESDASDTAIRNRRIGKVVYPLADQNGRIDTTAIFDIVEASSSFPLAFQPKSLLMEYPGSARQKSRRATDAAGRRRDLYLDGGVFDNNPVGLALELARPLYPALPAKDSVNVIYVNPGQLRDPLASLRAADSASIVPGGAASALRMLGGAISTARQYELQIVARESSVPLRLRLTSRGYPVVGEHLHSFGAFLARPFREYDFFVGVYDALYFVVADYACERRYTDRQCIATRLAQLVNADVINYGPSGSDLLDTLFAGEFPPSTYVRPPAVVAEQAGKPSSAPDADRTTLLFAVHRAQRTQWVRGEPTCGGTPLPESILCRNRLLEFLRAFARQDSARAIVGRRLRACEDSVAARAALATTHKSSATDPAACQEHHELVQLVRDPVVFASDMIDRLLERLLAVEHRVHLDVDSVKRAKGWRGRPDDRVDAERPIALLTSLYRGHSLRPRYGFEWAPTSAAGGPALLRYLIPYQIAGDLGSSGLDLAFRPTLHLGRSKLALFAPLPVHWAAVPAPVVGDLAKRRRVWYAGGGLGLAAKGVLPLPIGLAIPEFGFSAQALRRWAGVQSTDEVVAVAEVYGHVTLPAGRGRLALRYTPRGGPLFDGRRLGFSVGLADLFGIGYWIGRLWEP